MNKLQININPDEFGEQFESEMELMPELCGKSICEFYPFLSMNNYFARSQSSEIYAWGYNNSKNEYSNNNKVNLFKPRRVEFFDDKKIVKISSFMFNCFALSSNRTVYKFEPDFWVELKPRSLPEIIFNPATNVAQIMIKGALSSLIKEKFYTNEGSLLFYSSFMDTYYKPGIHEYLLLLKMINKLNRKKFWSLPLLFTY